LTLLSVWVHAQRMATRMINAKCCDVCVGDVPAQGTITVTKGSTTTSVDLCGDHLVRFDDAVSPFMKQVERVERRQPVTTARRATTNVGYTPKQVRDWAKKNKIAVPQRGRIPSSIVDKYLAARG